MKFIILVSNLKEISSSVFSWKKKEYIKKIRRNSAVKIWFGQKKKLNYAYVLKNWVDQYNIFFFIFTQSWILFCVSFSYRIRQCFIQFHDSIQCAMCFFVNNQFRTCANDFPNEFTVRSYEYARVNIEFFTGRKKIKQRRISFVLGYLLMILWKISTAISIKHRILATFDIK